MMGHNFQTLAQIFTKYWWILHILYFTR